MLQEAEEKSIVLQGDDPALVKLMISFFYQLDYDLATVAPTLQGRTTPAPITLPKNHTRVGTCIHGFRPESSCVPDVGSHEPSHLLVHVGLYALADKYLIPTLRELCVQKFRDCAHCHSETGEFAEAVQFVFERLPEHARDMREVVVKLLCGKMALVKGKEIMGLKVYGDLAKEVLWKKGEELAWW